MNAPRIPLAAAVVSVADHAGADLPAGHIAKLYAAADLLDELCETLEQFQRWLMKDAAPSFVGKEDMRVYQLEGGILSSLLNASRVTLAKARAEQVSA